MRENKTWYLPCFEKYAVLQSSKEKKMLANLCINIKAVHFYPTYLVYHIKWGGSINVRKLSTTHFYQMRDSLSAPTFPASLMVPLASWFLLAQLS